MTVYGDASQALLDLFKTHKVAFKWFSFLEGLERSPALPTRLSVAVPEALRPLAPST
jgi:hypothetical protein